jgi:hypothetical protein
MKIPLDDAKNDLQQALLRGNCPERYHLKPSILTDPTVLVAEKN